MNQNRGLAVLLVLMAMAIFWSYSHNKTKTVAASDEDVSETAVVAKVSPIKEEVASTPEEALPNSANQKLQETFDEALKGAQTCFHFQNNLQGIDGDFSLEAWKNALHSELGEVVLEAEDWTNTHLTLPNGEKRRIRIESEVGEDNRITKKLKYAGVDKDDLPVPINLPADQVTDPTDTMIASLEKEGQITLVEKAQRFYYSDGSEIMSVQRNNIVSEVEINKAGQSFHCWNLDKSNHQCDCL